MATITASGAQSIVPAKLNVNGDITVVRDYVLTGNPALSTGDVIQMVKVPNGAKMLNMAFITDALSGGNYTVTIGDGNSATRYSGSLSTGSTSSTTRLTNAGLFGYSYSTEDTIDIVIGTATTATASGTLRLMVTYTMDG